MAAGARLVLGATLDLFPEKKKPAAHGRGGPSCHGCHSRILADKKNGCVWPWGRLATIFFLKKNLST